MKLLLAIAVSLAFLLALLCVAPSLAQEPATDPYAAPRPGAEPSTYVTVPDDFPAINVTVPASNTAPGYVFITSFTGPGLPTPAPYLMILDNQGQPVFYQKQPPNRAGTDFKRQPNGWLTYYDRTIGKFRAIDQTYAAVAIYGAVNHWTNHHDFQLLPNGHQLYLIYDPRTVDMSQVVPGRAPNATVVGLIVQEVDASGRVAFEWRSWDHIALTDSNFDLTQPEIDLIHGNAVEVDYDGNLLISSRHLDEITKVDRQTGAVIWRWGGKRNQFTFVNDDRRFSHQHDIRLLPNGYYTVYDNGNRLEPEYSRALEYVLDQTNKTATLVWEYRNTPDPFGEGMGNAQRLPIRFPWVGRPSWPPTLTAQTEGGRTKLYYSWNGATEVTSYRIYGGKRANAVTVLVGTQVKTGFETSTDIASLPGDFCFFRVLPIDRAGHEMTPSNVVAVPNGRCHQAYLLLLR